MPPTSTSRIRHAVVFRLAHPQASEGEAEFLRAIRELAAIPGVEAFELAREVSPKNPFAFGLAMEFADEAAYQAYNGHPDHVRFVAERWEREVAEFLEIDTVALPAG
jgi:quinol monooxygenase YgiN